MKHHELAVRGNEIFESQTNLFYTKLIAWKTHMKGCLLLLQFSFLFCKMALENGLVFVKAVSWFKKKPEPFLYVSSIFREHFKLNFVKTPKTTRQIPLISLVVLDKDERHQPVDSIQHFLFSSLKKIKSLRENLHTWMSNIFSPLLGDNISIVWMRFKLRLRNKRLWHFQVSLFNRLELMSEIKKSWWF